MICYGIRWSAYEWYNKSLVTLVVHSHLVKYHAISHADLCNFYQSVLIKMRLQIQNTNRVASVCKSKNKLILQWPILCNNNNNNNNNNNVIERA